jgi:hypothetical protein
MRRGEVAKGRCSRGFSVYIFLSWHIEHCIYIAMFRVAGRYYVILWGT